MGEGTSEVCLVVRFQLLDQAAAALFDDLTTDVLRAIDAWEPGTLVYATHGVVDDLLARVFYEVYADQAAFRAHEDAEHVVAFHARKAPLLRDEPVVTFLDTGRAGRLVRRPSALAPGRPTAAPAHPPGRR